MASNPAPGDLELVCRFVNTLDIDHEIEELATATGLRDWLAERQLLEPGASVSDADRRHAVELREAFRAMLVANAGLELDPGAAPALDAAAARARLSVRFDEHGHARLTPQAAGVDGALGRLLAIVAEAQDEGTWPRLKACLCDDCQWAFYDRSRNRS